jgi:outer membrane protein, heavy metal efflux system
LFRPQSIAAWCVVLVTCANAAAQNDAPFKEPDGTLTLRDAVGAALLGSPTLAAFQWDIRAADARIVQAGLRPNPELGVEVEDVRWTGGPEQRVRTRTLEGAFQPGTVSVPTLQPDQSINVPVITPGATAGWEAEREQGAHSGFVESEFTLSISQEIELGRKRAKRVALANREKELAQWDYEAARADVIADTAAAFTEVLAAQERLGLHEELFTLAQDVARSIGLRVEAGQASPLQNNRAQVSLAATRRARDRAAREITIARARLAANWGSTNPLFTEVAGPLERVDDVPPLESLLDTIENNPDLARWSAELAAREAQLSIGARATHSESDRWNWD